MNNRVIGNKYSIIGEAIYEKKLTDANRLSFGVRHTQSFSDNEYRNGHITNTHMNQAESFVYGEFKGAVRKLNYTLGVGVNHYISRGNTYSYTYTSWNWFWGETLEGGKNLQVIGGKEQGSRNAVL